MIEAGVKELKNRLSHYLAMVKMGKPVIITERNQAIATIVPMERAGEDGMLLSLVKEGFAEWKGSKPFGSSRPVKIKGKTVSEMVIENRR